MMKRLQENLERLKAQGRYRSLQKPGGIDLTSNDYLGLRAHPGLRRAAIEALEAGIEPGAGGSRLLRGHTEHHEKLESYAAQFFGSEAALYFSSGYQANFALFTTLPGRQDVILYDEFIHASARDGIQASHARSYKFPHNNTAALESLLEKHKDRQIWIAVESLYSMDGDYAPLKKIFSLSMRYDAYLIIDEAHATGVLGPDGRGMAYDGCLSSLRGGRQSDAAIHSDDTGLLRPDGLAMTEKRKMPDTLIMLHTCGKALGVAGGLVCAPKEIIDTLINTARPFIYSTAPPPLQALLVHKALEIAGSPEGEDRRAKLQKICNYVELKEGVQGRPDSGVAGKNGENPITHIVPLILGADEKAVKVAATLQKAGYDIRAIRPPTVPEGTARLRLSLSSNLSTETLDGFFEALAVHIKRKAA